MESTTIPLLQPINLLRKLLVGSAAAVLLPAAALANADVATTLSGPSRVAAGSTVTYTVTITNNGPDVATSLAATLRLPRGLSAYGSVSGGTYAFNSGLLALALPNTSLASQASQTITVTFTAPNSTQPLTGKAYSTATSTDPNAGNNDGSASAAQLTTVVTLPLGQCEGVDFGGNPASQGLYGEYFKGDSAAQTRYTNDPAYFTGKTPNLTRTDANLNYFAKPNSSPSVPSNWSDIIVAATNTATTPEYFSVRERGFLVINTAGTYTISATVDDSGMLWVGDGARNTPPTGTSQNLRSTTTSYSLAAGATPIQILYANGPRANSLILSYSGPDTNDQTVVIPNSALCSARTFTGPLPVTLLSFDATRQGQQVALVWKTAQEINNLRFEIERSADGKTFAHLGNVASHGSGASTYTYLDAETGQLAGHTAYYRLRQVDADGSSTYSPVRVVALAPATSLAMYPNPVGSLLHVAITTASPQVALRAYSATGMLVRETTAATAEPVDLDLSSLPAGLYLLSAQTESGEVITKAFSKQ